MVYLRTQKISISSRPSNPFLKSISAGSPLPVLPACQLLPGSGNSPDLYQILLPGGRLEIEAVSGLIFPAVRAALFVFKLNHDGFISLF